MVRGFSQKQAAAYVGLSVVSFKAVVDAGGLPGPIKFGRRKVWDKRALDAAFDRYSGLNSAAHQQTEDERIAREAASEHGFN